MCKISIVVPIYNTKRYLNRCIDSILGIERSDIEVLLIDDGSNDGSSEICDSYSYDIRVKIVHKRNEGIAATRNLALEMAEGEYLYFCDADDYIEPGIFDSADFGNADMHVLGYIKETISQDSFYCEEVKCFDVILERDNLKECLYMDTKILYPLWNKVLKKSIIIDNNIKFENISCWEDAVFVMDYLMYAERVQFHSESVYHYQVMSGVESLSKQKCVIDRKNQYLLLYRRRFVLCAALGLSENEMKRADGRAGLIYNVTSDMLQNTTFVAMERECDKYKKYYDELFSLQEVKNIFRNPPKLKIIEAKICVMVVRLFYLTGNYRLFILFEKSMNNIKRVISRRK